MSYRSHTLMSGRWSGRRASLRKFFTSSGSKKLSSRVTRSTSAKLPTFAAASMYLKCTALSSVLSSTAPR